MENFIGENIAFLIKKNDLVIDDFGVLFDLSRGVTGQYIRKSSLPKIITIQKICAHYNISIDDFINKDLSIPQPYGYRDGNVLYSSEPENSGYQVFSPKYVELLEKSIEDKDKIISTYEEKLGIEKSKTA